ncbi:hypothetical protein PsorP6_009063 [Peronosclerospora sorghi]|uniref:Uncharacterized protein n=1 Tax=Peronosclerospora sorghi TaxID=230839 RepID=A0ACC0W1Y8_9STRA|nr:hypothetical protein PsorP6_009063 [Peronosclerospora sorghi]
MIDLSLRDDDKGTSAKRSKSTIHDKGEETLVLERADKSPSFSDRKLDTKIEETHVGAADKTLVVAETLDRKTRSGAHKIKLTRKKNVKKTKWELVESRGNPPLGRWGHSFTKIAGDQVVVYDGTDDDEQTLGYLHVFDTTRIAGQLHQIVKRLPHMA